MNRETAPEQPQEGQFSVKAYLAKALADVPWKSAQAVLELHKEGATVPFISRYRKEKTGNLDEVQVKAVIDSFETYNEVIKRQAFIVKEIESQGNLTDELKKRILIATDLNELEEIYRPYKKKKKTKATIAREAGLEPLAEWIWGLGHGEVKDDTTLEVKAKEYLNPAAKFITYDAVLKGAQDILIERVANSPELRIRVLNDVLENGKAKSLKTKEFKAHSKYDMYAEFEDGVKRLMDPRASHRYLAMRRGWQEGELAVTIEPGNGETLEGEFVRFACPVKPTQATNFLEQTAKLAYSGYVLPSVTNEVHSQLKEAADGHAIQVFAENVRRLLLASPFGSKCVLGVDPGLRTGCKIALVDRGGNHISNTVMHTLGDSAAEKAKKMFEELFKNITLDAIAVGNGTGGRETEGFLRKIMTELGQKVPVILVNESGASVYSASDVAREEFPELDLTVRGAISIARRLQDPLAELVKIDPKSIGVGQYQHDVSQPRLKKGLDFVVESCVNSVGVDVNTASAYLLGYVSGIGPALAKNIVEHRKASGLFEDRDALNKIPRFSGKVYEQAAGFLRVMNAKNILDQTGIHPERYSAVREMATSLGVTVSQLVGEGAKKLAEQRAKWVPLVGEFTFDDIVRELERPGRDPRDGFKVFAFRDDIFEVKDLKDGMICPGIVTNVTNFGAFVDIGVHQDGLVHISELADKFVDDPRKVVNPGDQVTIRVLKVDLDKNQISLSMRLQESADRRAERAFDSSADRAPEARPQQNRGGAGRGAGAGAPGPRGGAAGGRGGNRPQAGAGRGAAGAGSPDASRRGGQGPRPSAAPRAPAVPSNVPTMGGRPVSSQTARPESASSMPPRKQQSPFNNSFGSLADLKTQLKK
jgi:uncharacterized protein